MKKTFPHGARPTKSQEERRSFFPFAVPWLRLLRLTAAGQIFSLGTAIALDFGNLKDAGNTKPKGMWSDGETMWVADAADKKLYAYDFFTKGRLPNKDFNALAAGNAHPTGIWSDGTTMWVADWDDDKLYAYKMADKTRDAGKDFDTLKNAGNNQPIGLWSDGTTMWIADTEDDKVYAYKMADKARFSEVIDGETVYTKDIDVKTLIGNNYNPYPQGIWSNGTTMWVADLRGKDSKIYAFTLPAAGTPSRRDASKDLNVSALDNKKLRGIWSDETTMWVTDDRFENKISYAKIYAYRLSDAASLGELKITGHIPSPEYKDFNVDLKINDDLKPFNSGITRYTASVPYATASLTIKPTPLRTGDVSSILPADADATKDDHQVNLAVGENTISITVDTPETDTTSRPQTRTYTVVVTREFFTYNDPSKDVSLSTNWIPANVVVRGLWTDGATMWLSAQETGEDHDHFGKLYSYNLQSTNLVVSTNALTHKNPYGIWSDGTTMWIADDSDDGKLYAYNMWTNNMRGTPVWDGSLDSSKGFETATLQSAGNTAPQWIWSDGATMWVTDNAGTSKKADDDKIFAYEMSGDKVRDKSREIELGGLAKDNNAPAGIWSDGANLWIANNNINNAKIYSYKMAGNRIDCREETKDFNTLAAVDNTDPAAIFSDGSTMWVVDNTAKKIFAYNQPLSGNAWLKTLTLSGVYAGAQPFHFSNPGLEYPSAYVLDRTSISTTVTAIAQDPNAIVRINPQDTNGTLPGHQVSLRETSATVENKVTITVTSENGYIEKQYTVTIARNVHGQYLPARNIDMHADNNRPTGIWSDETTMWVVNNPPEQNPKIFAYNMWTTNQQQKVWDGSRDINKEFATLKNAGNTTPFGIWSNKTNMWVADEQENKIFAYVLESKMRPTSPTTLDFPYAYLNDAGNAQPRGLWSDGSTMWVSDQWDKKIYAYKASDKTRDISKEFDTLKGAGNQSPIGIWSDGTTMWVADLGRKKIFAYNMENKAYNPTKEFSTSSENSQPGCLWSDGKTLWVSDFADQKIYAYNIKTAIQDVGAGSSPVTDDPSLRVLALSGMRLKPAFSANRTFYTALVDHTVASTTVTATPSQALSAVNVMYKRGGGGNLRWIDSDGSPIALQEGLNRIAVEVTSEDGSVLAYVIEVTKSEAPPVSGGPLPQPQSFQLSATFSAGQPVLAGSAAGEWKSQLIFAEPLPNGGVRFVFLVPPEEFKIEITPDLLSREWRPLEDDEFTAVRESNVDSQDRLTVILPRAVGKQRFLRLTPLP